MLGSMLISGRRSGQVRLDILGDVKTKEPSSIDFIPTNPNSTFSDVLSDTQEKLESIKASPSPIESEISFLETWLKLALEPKVVKEKEKEPEKEVISIDIAGKKVESIQ